MALSPLHHRLRTVVGQRTYRELGEVTGTNAETARRYVLGQSPSLEFVVALCSAQGVNPTWLLTGEGPMRAAEAKAFALRDANAHELLAAVAFTLERLAERVGRLETFLHTLEVRLRAGHLPAERSEGRAPDATTQTGAGVMYETKEVVTASDIALAITPASLPKGPRPTASPLDESDIT